MNKTLLAVMVLMILVVGLAGCNGTGSVIEVDDVSGGDVMNEADLSGEGDAEAEGEVISDVQVEENSADTVATLEIVAPVLSLEEVAKHAVEGDCWTVIGGNVYDLSNALASHPGGNSQLEGCGVDGTELFETRPMGSGTPHSDKARGYLGNYLLGPLTN